MTNPASYPGLGGAASHLYRPWHARGQLRTSPRCQRVLVVAVTAPALARPLSLPQAILDRINGLCACLIYAT